MVPLCAGLCSEAGLHTRSLALPGARSHWGWNASKILQEWLGLFRADRRGVGVSLADSSGFGLHFPAGSSSTFL